MIPLVTIMRSKWDIDALDYLRRSAAADGEPATAKRMIAVNNFFKQCKSDASPVAGVSNLDAMANCGLLAGPRTLAGALIPLKGGPPTNVNFVSGDYNPITGLKGNGVNKYLEFPDTFNSPVYGQQYHHLSVYVNSAYSGLNTSSVLISYSAFGNRRSICYAKSSETPDPNQMLFRLHNGYSTAPSPIDVPDEALLGFVGSTRAESFPTHQVR